MFIYFQTYIMGGENNMKKSMKIACATVTAKAVKNGKAKKVTVMTYKAKKNEKRKLGHRQPYTKVEIVSVNA